MSTTLAFGLLAGATAPALADCPGHKVTADSGISTPIVTADTVAKPTDEKG
ncbi:MULTISPECIES: hypothetical protein [unclassified Aureimonas]|uniref:hypothetical protein n=1 Tax=unclassified Aureimonas TaxID=2615206 RepID=UPI0012E34F12|nr:MULTISPECIES: hypothetical protein [unclassified Aureimonas]